VRNVCFSAGGSFALSGVLTAAGAASLARNTSVPQRMFAAVPLLFAVQQASEGIVWLTVDVPSSAMLYHRAVLAFLGFALVVWPLWSPVCLRLIERDPTRHRILTGLSWFGGIVAAGASLMMMQHEPTARVAGHSITYDFGEGATGLLQFLIVIAYIVPTLGPFFVSTAKLARTIGTALVISVVVTAIIRHETLTSAWCFFAAIDSALIVFAVGQEQHASEWQQRRSTATQS
jgi:hypothetical protein